MKTKENKPASKPSLKPVKKTAEKTDNNSLEQALKPANQNPETISSTEAHFLQRTLGNQAIAQLYGHQDTPIATNDDTESFLQQRVNNFSDHTHVGTHRNESKQGVFTVQRQEEDEQQSTISSPQQQEIEVGNQFYGHGAFMGLARQMLDDGKWNRILQTLMPDVFVDVQNVPDEGALIPMLENNPVMAAYGMMRTQQLDQEQQDGRSDRVDTLQGFEWDVFLDPAVTNGYNQDDLDEGTERNLDQQLVDTMIIAHGTQAQTIWENLPGGSEYNSVRQTRKSVVMGGTRPSGWMDMFGRAIKLATVDDPEQHMTEMSSETRDTNTDDQSLFQTFTQQISFEEVINLYKQVLGKDTFSVILDLKSRNARPRIVRALITELNRRGVHVAGVGTFTFSELDNLDQAEQEVDGQNLDVPRAVKFFHGIGNLQKSCKKGDILEGDSVMFNAGSILDSVDWQADMPDGRDAEIAAVIQSLGAFKNAYGFHIGLYVQEGSIDAEAARKITEFSNEHAHIFDIGFAWGGLSDDMGPVNSGDSGIGGQSLLSKNWNMKTEPAETKYESTFHLTQFLESRHFKVTRGFFEVETHAQWGNEETPDKAYSLTLRKSELFADKTFDECHLTSGPGYARWDGLKDGTYYLEFKVPEQAQDVLDGELKVSL